MKTIYFLRHGQTLFNKTWRHQYDDTPLSEKGRAQVARAAKALQNTRIDTIVTSPQTRARETADIIGNTLGIAPEENVLFAELYHPQALHGTYWLSPRSLYAMGQLYLHAGDPEWRCGDGENLHQFHRRVREGLEYLTSRSEETILVVTHRGFISTALLQIAHDGMDTTTQYRATLRQLVAIKNAEYATTHWSPEGEGHPTLRGTWSIEV